MSNEQTDDKTLGAHRRNRINAVMVARADRAKKEEAFAAASAEFGRASKRMDAALEEADHDLAAHLDGGEILVSPDFPGYGLTKGFNGKLRVVTLVGPFDLRKPVHAGATPKTRAVGNPTLALQPLRCACLSCVLDRVVQGPEFSPYHVPKI